MLCSLFAKFLILFSLVVTSLFAIYFFIIDVKSFFSGFGFSRCVEHIAHVSFCNQVMWLFIYGFLYVEIGFRSHILNF